MDSATIKAQAVALGMLALNLSNELGRRVIDKTGLASKNDLNRAALSGPPRPPKSLCRRIPNGPPFSPHYKSNGLRL